MSDFKAHEEAFWQWLLANGATLSEKIGFKDYRNENAGRGVIALEDIHDEELLFSIPRHLLFSVQTAKLPTLPGMADKVDKMSGWNPLICCMMYESQLNDSFWKPYFDILPKEFTTPMFWNEVELEELVGTDIPGKIGKEEAESLYKQEIEPLIKTNGAVFDEKKHTLDLFHQCGSLIMAYSFHDEQSDNLSSDGEESDDDDDEEEEGLTVMVPMADMLNHKTGFNNARLFYEKDRLEMKAIKSIKKDEQIYNLYGSLCNADLLRKYGFVDEPNNCDLIEIDGRLVCDTCFASMTQKKDLYDQKIDWLMEEDILDDYFVIDTEYEVPPEMIIAVLVLSSTDTEFEAMKKKDKLPKPRLTADAKQILEVILQKRIDRYKRSLEDDLSLMQEPLSKNKHNAIVVRVGEQTILRRTLEKIRSAAIDQKRQLSHRNDEECFKKQRST